MPAWGGAERLAQLVGRSRAAPGHRDRQALDAASAQRLGLVDLVVPRAFDDEWRALARIGSDVRAGDDAREGRRQLGGTVLHPELEADATGVRAVVDGRRALGRSQALGAKRRTG